MTISKLGILGAGTMGRGIMINAVTHGFDVVLIDQAAKSLVLANSALTKFLDRQVAKDRMSREQANIAFDRLATGVELKELELCDLVIEAVFEDLDLKRRVMADLEAVLAPKAIIASNTSCLKIADIGVGMTHPSRLCGLHYFSPAEVNPVVEMIEAERTDPANMERVVPFLAATKRLVVACKDTPGFALNRFFCPYSNEAVRILDEGLATTGQIDSIACDTFELAIGPFGVMNIIGTATNLNAVRNLAPLGAFYEPAQGLIAKGEARAPWAIEQSQFELHADTKASISRRLLGAVLLPVLEELDEGTATLEAIDTGASSAFRFGKTPGELITHLGRTEADKLAASLARRYGHKQLLKGLSNATCQ